MRSGLKVGKDPQSPCADRETLPLTQRKYVARLEELREALENSPFFKTHEVRAPAAMGSRRPRVGGWWEVGGWGFSGGGVSVWQTADRLPGKAIKRNPQGLGFAF